MENNVTHSYVEVGTELLSKPSALCDILESRGGARALVFCNNPSDTDFVEVILKKRGLNASKLIGFVSPEKLTRAMERIDQGELAALVVTDIAARGLDLSKFETVLNYSLPSDIETYAARSGNQQPGTRSVISLVAPLDIAAFHGIRKASESELSQINLPSAEDLAKARVANLKRASQSRSFDATTTNLAKAVIGDAGVQEIVSYLLQNTFELVPQLQANIEKLTWERENLEDEDGEQPSNNSRDDSYDRRGGGRDRDDGYERRGGGRDRGERRDSRGGRDRGGRGEREDRGGRRGQREDRDSGGFRGRRDRSDEYEGLPVDDGEGEEQRQRPQVTRLRDERLYLGKGKKQGFSREEFETLLRSSSDIDPASMKRFYLRGNYAFADFPEGVGDQVVKTFEDASKLFVSKAIQVVTVIEQATESAGSSAEDSSEGGDSFENASSEA